MYGDFEIFWSKIEKKLVAAHRTSPESTFKVNCRSTNDSCRRSIGKRAMPDLVPSRFMVQVPHHLQDYPWPTLA